MSAAKWEPFKSELEHLYCSENKTLHEIWVYMERTYGFKMSRQQYERQFKRWRFNKKQAKTKDWKPINIQIEKRKLIENKESEVHVDGVQVPPEKVKRIKLHKRAYVPMAEIVANAPSPPIPKGVVVCTPVSTGMDLEWNNTFLPWLRFVKLFPPGKSEGAPTPSTMPSRSLSLSVPLIRDLQISPQNVSRALIQRLNSTLSWEKLKNPPSIYSSSRIAAILTILIPEESKGDHLQLSSRLRNSAQEGKDWLDLELFLLSNNFLPVASNCRTEEAMSSNDKYVMEMFKQSGWNNINNLQVLLSTDEPTPHAIAEKFFASAIRLFDAYNVRMMLDAGMDAETIIETSPGSPLSALQFASTCEAGSEIIKLLLSHGADVNRLCSGYSALEIAIAKRNKSGFQTLMAKGATITASCLSAVARYIDISFSMGVIKSCLDVKNQTESHNSMALICAVQICDIQIINMLISRGADVNTLVSIQFQSGLAGTTVLGYAVVFCPKAVPILLHACQDINPAFQGFHYVSPLILAVHTGNTETTSLLLEAGIDIAAADKQGKMTLLERAADKNNPRLWQLLIAYGARVEKPVSEISQPSSPVLDAVPRHNYNLLGLPIQAGSRLNDEYSQFRWKIPETALLNGDHVLAQYLLQYGANFTRHAASFQGSDLGVLPLDMDVAIKTHNFDLTKILLKKGAKINEHNLVDVMDYPTENTSFFAHLLSFFHGSGSTVVGVALLRKPNYLEVLREAAIDPTGTPNLFRNCWNPKEFGIDIQPDLSFDMEPPQSVLEIAVILRGESLDFLLQWIPWGSRLTGRALIAAICLRRYGLIDSILKYNPGIYEEYTCKYFLGGIGKHEMCFTPLQAAVKEQLVSVAQLLSKSSDVNYLGNGARCYTPLQHAVYNGDMDLINMLLKCGARVGSPPAVNGGSTALQIAAIRGYIGIARKLIDLGADVNEAPAKVNGRTALQGAAEQGRIDMLQMLLNEMPLVDGENEPGYLRAVELAENRGHNVAAGLLKSYRARVELIAPQSVQKLFEYSV